MDGLRTGKSWNVKTVLDAISAYNECALKRISSGVCFAGHTAARSHRWLAAVAIGIERTETGMSELV